MARPPKTVAGGPATRPKRAAAEPVAGMPSAMGPDCDDDEKLAEMAEEVRAYLVLVRGGAPFLSGADGRLLVAWLQSGVSVATILAAVDRVAERRAARRSRSRLTLAACKSEVKKLNFDRPGTGGHGPWARTETGTAEQTTMPAPDEGLGRLIDAIEATPPDDPALSQAWARLVSDLRRPAACGQESESTAREAISATRRFHEAAWAASLATRAELLAEAERELTGLRAVLSEEAFSEAVEEVARSRVRSRFPLVSARAVYDSLSRT